MANRFQSILGGMIYTRDGTVPSIQGFPQLDEDALARELSVVARAEELAEEGQPASSAQEPESVERSISLAIERRANRAHEDYREQLGLYDSRIQRWQVSPAQQLAVESEGQNVIADYQVHISDDSTRLYGPQHHLRDAHQELQRFRREHRLTRPPLSLSPAQLLLRVLILAILLILETALNGMFFAAGSQAGLVGGVTQAFVFSFLNLGTAVLCARVGIAWGIHRRRWVQAAGLLMIVLLLAWCLTLNLTIAHFRDLYVQLEGEVSATQLFERLAAAPFGLDDFQSWLLFVLGLSFAIIAFVDALGLGELYPGYGRRADQWQKALDEYVNLRTNCLIELQELRDKAVGEMQEVVDAMQRSEYELHLAVTGRSRLHSDFRHYLDHLDDLRKLLTRQFRDVNERMRDSAPPSYFKQMPSRPSLLEPPKLETIGYTSTEIQERVIETMRTYIKRVNSEFKQALPLYKDPEAILQKSDQASEVASGIA